MSGQGGLFAAVVAQWMANQMRHAFQHGVGRRAARAAQRAVENFARGVLSERQAFQRKGMVGRTGQNIKQRRIHAVWQPVEKP
ncbi:MAG: hypothetical protein BWZ10_01220 [candidate division BRC1 bacterium ADurb.BinA364]|nr:MAG: hypothetical protein BWZ10_01220 [candidate division BRC1 bacterium ADurb.BinA364]